MISVFVREQRQYSKEELSSKLMLEGDSLSRIIQKLKAYGLLKETGRQSYEKDITELLDDSVEVNEYNNEINVYVFNYVGVIDVDGVIIKCYPKYLSSYDNKEEGPVVQLQTVLKVLEKHGNVNGEDVDLFDNYDDVDSFNMFSLLLFLLNDYYEHGIYNNISVISESNGPGEIIWDKTVNETTMILSDDAPYYIDLQTRKNVMDDNDYFTRLHKCVLMHVSRELYDAGLTELFGLTVMDLLSEETIDDFGEISYILYKIEKELNMQFNTRKRQVLKAIYAYIARKKTLTSENCLVLWGTKSFHVIWEDACSEIFDNQLNKKLSELTLPIPLDSEEDGNERLIDKIEKPLWTYAGMRAGNTLIPDIISLVDDSFVILDAKYYTPYLEKGKVPARQPGIESVTKQYLYQLSYKHFIEKHGFKKIHNSFLFPAEEDGIYDKGEVKMEMLSDLNLGDIKVRFLSAKVVFNMYLDGKKMSVRKLKL